MNEVRKEKVKRKGMNRNVTNAEGYLQDIIAALVPLSVQAT